jgi:hypothetical protein
MKRSCYRSCLVAVIYKLLVCWTHLFAHPVTLVTQTASTQKRLNYVNPLVSLA